MIASSFPYEVLQKYCREKTSQDHGEGLPRVLGNKGTLAKYRGEQGNINPFLENRGTKLYKLEGEIMVNPPR